MQHGSDEDIYDKVPFQRSLYQREEISEHFYMKPETELSQSTHSQPWYSSYASSYMAWHQYKRIPQSFWGLTSIGAK